MAEYGTKRVDLILEPVTGKALPVYRGEVLRMVQVDCQQCVDFNAYSLYDYKEFMEASNTRGHHGFRPTKGDFLWTQHSRNRPMYAILEMPPSCVTDLARGGRVQLRIYDVAGRLVRTLVDAEMPAGRDHEAIWNGLGDQDRRAGSGVYFYSLDAAGERLARKLVLMQ